MAASSLSLAFASLLLDQFFGKIMQAFEQFVTCDSYPILAELLTRQKENATLIKAKAKLSNVFNLLDAHVYAKVGDYGQECKSMLAFLRGAYAELSTY
eukprot:CAMPEP_0170458790 /NCGR_PEP_ID=MMETSP0123-20130129/5660_1 /TAXON_ID=182087 /ORGANISM="Favella ehrenbergii, Strain Fehren 1" /LENGTH=97 /DNA_ID=CAMNT_0010723091 /DNA_START=1105 /DNA_END=1398 /DNA_ORIENTATION=-